MLEEKSVWFLSGEKGEGRRKKGKKGKGKRETSSEKEGTKGLR